MFLSLLAIIYMAFISLGLPDALLGAAWPTMYPQLGVPVSYAGIVSMTIAAGTVISSLLSDRLTRRFGTGLVTAVSVGMTALALLGFSVSRSFGMLMVWAVPYGLGAGSVDASLNNYVALHYESRHMSWLHCMWGVGATAGPYIMGAALALGRGWPAGYRAVGAIQVCLTALLFFSLKRWVRRPAPTAEAAEKPLTLVQTARIPGAWQLLVSFLCYSAVEQTAMLWGASYLTLHHGVSAESAAVFASLFVLGITLGRAVSGFITLRLNDRQMINLGESILGLGILLVLLPLGRVAALAGLILSGLGCAPIYPCIIHSTPALFGESRSQAMIGLQMACAYIGTTLMPPLFGLVARHISISLFPVYLALFALAMILLQAQVHQITQKE